MLQRCFFFVLSLLLLQSDFHQLELIKLLSQEIGCDSQQILDFDLHLADTQPAVRDNKAWIKVIEEFMVHFLLENVLMSCATMPVGQIAELVEHCTSSAEIRVRIPVQAFLAAA